MDIESFVDVYRKEQAQTDNWIAQLSTGREPKRRKDSVEFDKRLKNIVLDYKEYEIFDY